MLFSKKIKQFEEPKEPKAHDRVARGIAGFLLSVQNRFSSFLSSRMNNLSNRSKQICLVIFCLMFGGFSIYAFVGAFRDAGNSGKRIKPDQVSVPKYYDCTDNQITEPSVGERDIIRINHFKKYMDSLRAAPKGRLVYDSILKARPGLMDSIQAIEQIYYSQSK